MATLLRYPFLFETELKTTHRVGGHAYISAVRTRGNWKTVVCPVVTPETAFARCKIYSKNVDYDHLQSYFNTSNILYYLYQPYEYFFVRLEPYNYISGSMFITENLYINLYLIYIYFYLLCVAYIFVFKWSLLKHYSTPNSTIFGFAVNLNIQPVQ